METSEIVEEVSEANYITCDQQGQLMLHKTLRDIAAAYSISHTTISKAFSTSDCKTTCTCKSKTYGIIAIRKLCSI